MILSGYDIERFWAKVEKTDGCWLWRSTIKSNGYGLFRANGRTLHAHRVSVALAHGEPSPGLFVCHHCDVRNCVRPDHLFVGTHTDNMRDCGRKGRTTLQRYPEKIRRGTQVNTNKLTPEQVLEIRALLAGGAAKIALARRFMVSRRSIQWIAQGRNWRHLLGIAAAGVAP